MRLLRWSSCLLLVLLLVIPAVQAAPLPQLRLVSDAWPPFTDVPGKPRQALDLVKEALARSGVEVSFTITQWNVALLAIERAQQDGSAAIWKTAERERTLLFSRPYLENRLLLVGRRGTDVSATSLTQLAGKRVALTRGYAYGPALERAQGLVHIYHQNDASSMRAVLEGKADYLLLDELMVHDLRRHDAARSERLLAVGNTPLIENSLHLALRRTLPRAAEIIAGFDKAIVQMLADGSYNRVLGLAWIRADIDGDGVLEHVTSSRAPQLAVDPRSATIHAGYPVFLPPARAASAGRAPAYLVDGKRYDNWGEVTTTLERSGPTIPDGPYRYATGFVLADF
ncbi:MAG: transporter substrate-binding domain-containing protein [Polyangiaceae bacterium]